MEANYKDLVLLFDTPGSIRVYGYRTDDALEDVCAEGYFRRAVSARGLLEGDQVQVLRPRRGRIQESAWVVLDDAEAGHVHVMVSHAQQSSNRKRRAASDENQPSADQS